MDRQKAVNLAERWPEWMKEWGKEALKKWRKDKDLSDDIDYCKSLYKHAIQLTKENKGMIQWFIHCLYARGYKIVPKRGRKE